MKILVIDDEQGLRHTLSLILGAEGHDVRVAPDGNAGLQAATRDAPDLVLTDVRMPGLDGFGFLDRYRAAGGTALVIMMSAYGDDEAALEAIRRGAYDFIAKPFRADQVLLVVRKAMEREGLVRQVAKLSEELSALREAPGDASIVGRSAALSQVIALATKVARHPSTVLVTGESGTGKELVAQLIHTTSPRASGPFVAVNCGAIPEPLLESELFGHVRGAFTGAESDRRGLFEDADGGTLLLDELGDLPSALQIKLLRVLQENEIRRVGDNATRPVSVRVIAATSRDLEEAVADGTFRADLYYRVNVVRLHLPPLRERGEDIPALVRHFIGRFNAKLGLDVTRVAPDAMRALMDHPWPGNVRELENVIERMMVLSESTVLTIEQLPAAFTTPAASASGGVERAEDDGSGSESLDGAVDLSVKRHSAALERRLIRVALQRTSGNRTRAARLLDLSHRALLYKIREYGLDD